MRRSAAGRYQRLRCPAAVPRFTSDLYNEMAPPVVSSDPHVERLRAMQLQTWQLAYCRDVVKSVAPSTIKGVRLAPGTIMIGRAYTVSGPEIYLDALEGIKVT